MLVLAYFVGVEGGGEDGEGWVGGGDWLALEGRDGGEGVGEDGWGEGGGAVEGFEVGDEGWGGGEGGVECGCVLGYD